MFRKAFTAAALVLLAALTLTGCAGTDHTSQTSDISRKVYVYEKDGFPDKFGIRLYENGEFTYYVGSLSSHIGDGNWERDGDILTLTENPDSNGKSNIFRFNVDGDTLSYIAEGSDNFMHIKVSDGEKFTAEELEGFPYKVQQG